VTRAFNPTIATIGETVSRQVSSREAITYNFVKIIKNNLTARYQVMALGKHNTDPNKFVLSRFEVNMTTSPHELYSEENYFLQMNTDVTLINWWTGLESANDNSSHLIIFKETGQTNMLQRLKLYLNPDLA